MSEARLKEILEYYRAEGPYLLAVEGARLFTGINLDDGPLACLLWQQARQSGVATYVKLTYWPPTGPEMVLGRWVAGDGENETLAFAPGAGKVCKHAQ